MKSQFSKIFMNFSQHIFNTFDPLTNVTKTSCIRFIVKKKTLATRTEQKQVHVCNSLSNLKFNLINFSPEYFMTRV